MPLESAEKRQKKLPIPSMWPSILRLLRKLIIISAGKRGDSSSTRLLIEQANEGDDPEA